MQKNILGIQYPTVHSDGSTEDKPTQLAKWDVSHSGSFPNLNGTLELQLGATLYLLPTFVITIDRIGGPRIGGPRTGGPRSLCARSSSLFNVEPRVARIIAQRNQIVRIVKNI